MSQSAHRHQLFDAARIKAEWTVQQLWVEYLALGGTGDAFDIEAFLQGLGSFSDHQQDVLATAVNERLEDLYRDWCVSYLRIDKAESFRGPDPMTIIDELLGATSPDEQTDS
jgi:hypothetical protein